MQVDRTRFLMLTSALAAACARSPGVASGGKPPPGEVASGGASGQPGVVDVPEAAGETEEEQAPASRGGCDDMSGRPPSCNDMRLPGPTCEQGMNVPPNVCNAIAKVAKPRIAAEVMGCLVDRSKEGGKCGPSDWTGDCAIRALDKVCSVDRAHEKECKEIETRCGQYKYRSGPPLTAEQCVRFVSAVLPAEQRSALTCVSEGCGVDYCFVSLAWNKAR
jgi:hypothetical protein